MSDDFPHSGTAINILPGSGRVKLVLCGDELAGDHLEAEGFVGAFED